MFSNSELRTDRPNRDTLTRLAFLSFLVVAAAVSRLVPHPWNFTPVGAMALFGGSTFASRRTAYVLPFLALILSDFIPSPWTYVGLHPLMPLTYACFLLNVWLGRRFLQKRNVGRIAGTTLLGAVIFYLVTNFGVWVAYYEHTWDGLQECYTLAIPYFGNTLAGDMLFAGVLFGALALAEAKFPLLRPRRNPVGALG